MSRNRGHTPASPHRDLILSAAACVFLLAASVRSVAAPLNVVLILVDDLGWTDLSSYGSTYYETPNIDRLARSGMRFTNAYASSAVCSPTRAAVLTGRYPARLGVTDWIDWRYDPKTGKNPVEHVARADRRLSCPPNAFFLELSEVTLAEALGEAGYVSAHVGKWHLGSEGFFPEDQGFDVNFAGCAIGAPPSFFDPYERPGWHPISNLEPRREGEYLTHRECENAIAFIEKHRERPFFLHYAPYAVHTPIQAPEELVRRYRSKPPSHQRNPTYAAMVHSVDEAVGKVLDTLERLELADRTLVLFASDNGGESGSVVGTHNAPLRAGKGHPYEGGIRVPLIVRWPEVVEPGSLSHMPVSSVDYFPTILEATGTPLPAGREIDGVSLVEHLRSGGERTVERDLFWHFPHYRHPRTIPPYSIVRSGRWKLIYWWEDGRMELFDLENDLAEVRDVVRKERQQDRVAALRRRLMAHLRSVGARLPVPSGTGATGKVFAETRLRIEAGVAFLEGPAWHESGDLYFSDPANNRILRRDRGGKTEIHRFPSGKANGLLFDRRGRLIACEGPGEGGNRRVTRTELDGSVTVLTEDFEGARYNGPNDLAIDGRGRIYFTDPRYGNRDDVEMLDAEGRLIEGVYRILGDGEVERLLAHEVDRPNGIAVAADDSALFVVGNNNSHRGASRKVWRFAMASDGRVDPAARSLLHDFGEGRGGDGLALDTDGRLYVAAGINVANDRETAAVRAGIYVIAPSGGLVDFLPVADDVVTNCTFGGSELRTLFITAGHRLLSLRVDTPGWLAWPPPRTQR